MTTDLTQAEAQLRAATVSNVRYAVDLDLSSPGDATARSTTRLTFDAVEGSSTFVDAEAVTVHALALNGAPLDVTTAWRDGRVHVSDLLLENVLEVDASFPVATSGEGLHRFVDPADGETYFYTFTAPAFARQVFACFDQPDLKGEFAVTVTAPASWTVLSNALPLGAPEERDGSALLHRFAPTPPIATYLLAVAAGPWHSWHAEATLRDGRVVPLAWHARASLADAVAPDVDALHDLTRRGLEAYEQLFDHPFVFDSYDQVFVPEHVVGAMENPGLVTFSERMVHREAATDAEVQRRELTVLHEMAHQWFGDLVTMRWWDDLWLNESFADLVAALVASRLALAADAGHDPWVEFAITRKGWASAQDLLPTTHPVVGDVPDLESLTGSFDGITYGKGAAALRQLAAVVGEDAFFAGVADHLRRHAFGSATLGDLLASLERAAGRELGEWARLWLRTSGVNRLRASWIDGAVRLEQHPDEADGLLRPRRVDVALLDLDHDGPPTRRLVAFDLDGATAVQEVRPGPADPAAGPARARTAPPALVLANAGDLDYAVVELDDASLGAVGEFLRRSDHGLDRAVVHASLWRAVTAARLAAPRYLRLVLDGLPAEVDASTLRTVLGQVQHALAWFVPGRAGTALVAEVGTRLWDLAREAEPGLDRQVQFVRAFTEVAGVPEHAAVLRGLRSGSLRLDGFEVGGETAWRLLTALVRAGEASGGEVDAAEHADPTDVGRRWAARARASAADVGSKQRAWLRVLRDDALSPELVTAIGEGWRSTGGADAFAGHAEAYVAALDHVWAHRGVRAAQDLTAEFAPPPELGAAGVDALRGWLDAHPAPTGARRAVREALARLEEALAARELTIRTLGDGDR